MVAGVDGILIGVLGALGATLFGAPGPCHRARNRPPRGNRRGSRLVRTSRARAVLACASGTLSHASVTSALDFPRDLLDRRRARWTGIRWLKTLHILFAIVAVGVNVTYGIWQARAGREPEHSGFALRGIKFLDDRVANPSYAGLLIVGILLVLLGPWEFTQFWIYAAIGLYLVMGAVAFFFYSPTLKRQIAAYEAGGAGTAEFAALGARARLVGIILAVIVVTIIVLMVVKPG